MRKTLIINSGSSSLKYKLYTMPGFIVDCEGIIERIGISDGEITLKYGDEKIVVAHDFPTHKIGIDFMLSLLEEKNLIDNKNDITKVGHRVVQGGELYKSSTLVDEAKLQDIFDLAKLAPLHNVPNADGIKVFMELLPHAINVAVFDTEFHQSMPEVSYMYPVPYEWYEKYDVRRYGAHGTSHKYITNKLAEIVNKDKSEINLINCHLGNGASLTAISGGKSIQTSMGLTPLAGIMMGTRSGDIDPSILEYMNEQTGESIKELTSTLNKKSGMLGISGLSSDFRDIESAAQEGNERAQLTIDLYCTRIIETIGSYAARLGRVDYITFTGGIGENAALIRNKVLNGLQILGIELDEEKNQDRSQETRVITKDSSKVVGYIIPTDEEYQICLEAEAFNN